MICYLAERLSATVDVVREMDPDDFAVQFAWFSGGGGDEWFKRCETANVTMDDEEIEARSERYFAAKTAASKDKNGSDRR